MKKLSFIQNLLCKWKMKHYIFTIPIPFPGVKYKINLTFQSQQSMKGGRG